MCLYKLMLYLHVVQYYITAIYVRIFHFFKHF